MTWTPRHTNTHDRIRQRTACYLHHTPHLLHSLGKRHNREGGVAASLAAHLLHGYTALSVLSSTLLGTFCRRWQRQPRNAHVVGGRCFPAFYDPLYHLSRKLDVTFRRARRYPPPPPVLPHLYLPAAGHRAFCTQRHRLLPRSTCHHRYLHPSHLSDG